MLTVPSKLGYGDDGVPAAVSSRSLTVDIIYFVFVAQGIPGGADLQFEIEVVTINGAGVGGGHESEVDQPANSLLSSDGVCLYFATPFLRASCVFF